MGVLEKLSPEKKAEYRRRTEKVRKNPNAHIPSEYHRNMMAIYETGAGEMQAISESVPWPLRTSCVSRSAQRMAGNALPHAGALGNTKECDFLINSWYADVDTKDADGYTALFNAVRRKRLGTAEYLLKNGAKILPNKKGWNPVLWACREEFIPALNMFKHYGVDFNRPYAQWTWKKGLPKKEWIYPIKIALLSNKASSVRWLLDNGISVNDQAGKDCTVRGLFEQNPKFFTQEIQQMMAEKMLSEPEKTIPTRPKKKTFFQKLKTTKNRD